MRTGRSRQQNKFSVILVHDDDNRCDIVSYHAEFIYKGVVVATLARRCTFSIWLAHAHVSLFTQAYGHSNQTQPS